MDDSLLIGLNKVIAKINKLKLKSINEAQTKKWLIEPFFELLGWDFSNPDEVVPEDDDGTGKRPDYCFYINGEAKFLVEAKSLGFNLNDNKMITEKLNYCSNSGSKLLIITDGNTYRVYYSELKGIGKDKLLQDFTLVDNIDEEFIDKLSKSAFISNRLINYAKNIYVLTNVKKATEKLFLASDEKLINLVNDNVKELLGHKFGNDEIEEALKQFSLMINIDLYDSVNYSEPNDQQEKDEADMSLWTVEQQFKNLKWKFSYDLYQHLIKNLKEDGLCFKEKPTKLYIGLISEEGNINFCQIHGQKSGLKMWLNLSINDLSEQETLRIRDVSKIGHWGMGDLESTIDDLSDIDWISILIKKAYQKYIK